MSEVPEELRYTQDHQWVTFDEDASVATVGLTDHAQFELGDVIGCELPAVGAVLERNDEALSLESAKATATFLAPLRGKVVEVNADLEDDPGAVNSDPYVGGWLYKLEVEDDSEIEELLSAGEYEELLAEEG